MDDACVVEVRDDLVDEEAGCKMVRQSCAHDAAQRSIVPSAEQDILSSHLLDPLASLERSQPLGLLPEKRLLGTRQLGR